MLALRTTHTSIKVSRYGNPRRITTTTEWRFPVTTTDAEAQVRAEEVDVRAFRVLPPFRDVRFA